MKCATVGELADQIRGVTYSKGESSEIPLKGYSPILRANNISEFGLDFENLIYVPDEKISSKQRLKKDDVVIAASSGSLSVVGKAARYDTGYDGAFGAFCKVLRPDASQINGRYFSHYFRTLDYRRRVSALAAGANINNLKNEHLNNLPIPLPPSPSRSGSRGFWMRRTHCGPSGASRSTSLTA